MKSKILTQYKKGLTETINHLGLDKINLLTELIIKTANQNGTVYLAGNGGSASTGSHFCNDLNKTYFHKMQTAKKFTIKAVNLSDNVPLLTAWANDLGYDDVFSSQLEHIGSKNDLLIVFSGSGNSKNIISALKTAKSNNIVTFGILGFDGGKALKLADNYIHVKSKSYGIVEDIHLVICHMVTELLKQKQT